VVVVVVKVAIMEEVVVVWTEMVEVLGVGQSNRGDSCGPVALFLALAIASTAVNGVE
jgi:hypothetical protein